MVSYGLVGDAHLGFKAYDTDRRTDETTAVFEQAIDLLSHLPVVCFAGDLFDDTSLPNKVKRELLRIKEKHHDQVWVILGGNHDSTKTYSSVSALDAFAEVHNVTVVNSFAPVTVGANGLNILCVPHMRSQHQFLASLDELISSGLRWDVCLLHCMVNSNLDLSPNDLNIDLYRLSQLSARCKHTWIGHQHEPFKVLENVYIPGSTLEFDFGQLGAKYVYEVLGSNIKLHTLTPPRAMKEIEVEWTGAVDMFEQLKNLNTQTIYKVSVYNVPFSEYSTAKAALDVIESGFQGNMLTAIHKVGHKEITVTEIDASFDILEEFRTFSTEHNVPNAVHMMSLLEDSVAEALAEEDD